MSEEQKKSEIEINGLPYQISAKRLTFFDIQKAAPLFMNSNFDFSDYWRYAFSNWLLYDDYFDVDNLTPEEGKALAELLPDPSQIMDWLVFRPAKSAASNNSFMADPSAAGFATNEKGWSTF